MKCQRRIYSGISSSSRFPFEFANVPSLICLLTRGPSSWPAICISPVLSFALSNKKTPICSFEQENLKSKKIQKKCCPTPKHCAAFNTGHAKRADDRKNLHWESCDICFNVFSQTMKKKRLHVSLRMRKFFQTNIKKKSSSEMLFQILSRYFVSQLHLIPMRKLLDKL